MSATKTKILAAALRQFNERGTDAVTVRSVADEIGISHGNLCYHYKNTDVLIEALYLQLVEEINQNLLQVQQSDYHFRMLYEQMEATFRVLYRYRFLLLDFVRINRRIPAIRDHFRQLMTMRQQQFRLGIDQLIQSGLMNPPHSEEAYNNLIQHLLLLSDTWIPRAEILHDESGEPIIRYYTDLVFGILIPYLTESGIAELKMVREAGNFS